MIKEQQTTLAVSSYLKSEVLHLQLRKSKLDLQGFLHRQRNRKTGKRIPLRIHPTYSPVSLQWWVIRAEGLVHVPQPSCAMSFPRHIALTSKNTGVSHSSPVFDSVLLTCWNKWSYWDEMSAPPNLSTWVSSSTSAGLCPVLTAQGEQSRFSSSLSCQIICSEKHTALWAQQNA